jgi:glutamate-1-semialdehyde 2,1-aminomutase
LVAKPGQKESRELFVPESRDYIGTVGNLEPGADLADDVGITGAGPKSRALWERAVQYEPLGVQGEGKFYAPYPMFIAKAKGAYITDVDGVQYLDYWAAAGPAVLGHAEPRVVEQVASALSGEGVLFCAPHEREVELAQRLNELVPSAEKSAFVCGGSDAIAFAARLARSVTGRARIVQFEGSYHGWYDSVLFSIRPMLDAAGPDNAPRAVMESSGLPASAEADIRVLPYNDIGAFERLIAAEGREIALVLIEPILHSSGSIMPRPGFLERIRELCSEHGILLLFDEIISGFRHALGGAQSLLGITPDLTALGKGMSNGFPLSALVGRANLIDELSPAGAAFFSGTFNGNVMCATAALATIRQLEEDAVHEHTFRLGDMLRDGINEQIETYGADAHCAGIGSVWCLYFSAQPMHDYRSVARNLNDQLKKQARLRETLLDENIFIYPRWVNRSYISAAHTEENIEHTLRATDRFFRENKAQL